ncbi:MAG: DUF72 domain-containing protein [Parvibaculaceae bacterium]
MKAIAARGAARVGVTSRKAAALHVGTSGWHYKDWWGPFFPAGVSKKDALPYYATRFATTELNAPFYRLPSLAAVDNWFARTPADFRFAWKASQFITHWKRLSGDLAPSLSLQEERVSRLRHKLGPILYQLPPGLKEDNRRLAGFVRLLKPRRRYSFEFRHPSWYGRATFDLLKEHDISLCLSDHAAAPAPREVTASWVYVRNHGPGGRYHGTYSDEKLRDMARAIRRWRKDGRDVWCFFDNDVKSAAPADAQRLLDLLQRRK